VGLTAEQEEAREQKAERDMKKLLTVAKSKYYLLRVNFPQAFEETRVDQESTQTEDALLKEKKREAPVVG
jgi:hypothetical protein